MTLEESREVIPMMEDMINQIEEQQVIMAEMYQELVQRDGELILLQEQNQKLQELNDELQEQLKILPSIEELLEKQDARIGKMEAERRQWRELAERLNTENCLLQKQNLELLKLNNG